MTPSAGLASSPKLTQSGRRLTAGLAVPWWRSRWAPVATLRPPLSPRRSSQLPEGERVMGYRWDYRWDLADLDDAGDTVINSAVVVPSAMIELLALLRPHGAYQCSSRQFLPDYLCLIGQNDQLMELITHSVVPTINKHPFCGFYDGPGCVIIS